jgi:hypothetical protein
MVTLQSEVKTLHRKMRSGEHQTCSCVNSCSIKTKKFVLVYTELMSLFLAERCHSDLMKQTTRWRGKIDDIVKKEIMFIAPHFSYPPPEGLLPKQWLSTTVIQPSSFYGSLGTVTYSWSS